MKTHLVIGDQHAHYKHHNKRADWLGELIADVKPDVVINIGDAADMPSLSGYDKGKKSFQGRTYRADIDTHLEFQDRLWWRVKRRKKSLPKRIFCLGNHEHRITRAIEFQPELEGAIGLGDLKIADYYDEFVDYEGGTPGLIEIDGITYAHYFIGGIAGRPLSGTHPADTLITKKLSSATCGHSHLADWSTQTALDGRKVMGCVVGCYQDYDADWAGVTNGLWWRGVVIKRGVEAGSYDPSFVSLNRLKQEYKDVE